MNNADANRHLRSIQDFRERNNEWKIKRIQASFDLDRDSAAQTLEWMQLKAANQFFAGSVGLLAGLFVQRRWMPHFASRSYIFRKPWIAPILPVAAFYCGYVGAIQLRGRRFQGKDVNFERMTGENDIVSRFRNQDLGNREITPSQKVSQYLANTTAITRSELEKGVTDILAQPDTSMKNKTIKRLQKDKDDIYWMFGRIHGLENIAHVDDAELAKVNGDPVKLQKLISQVGPSAPKAQSHDGMVSNNLEALSKYKQIVNSMTLRRSDRSKLLALPFHMQRRSQGPAPKKGMWQYDFFTELAGGKEWHHYKGQEIDTEKKLTAYNYEKHLPPSYLEHVDTSSPEFKKQLKLDTLLSKTQLEKHEELKENFRELMKVLSYLDEEEGRAFYHLLKNNQNDYLEDIHGGHLEATLAKISEEEGYKAKNDYWLRRTTLDYMDKSDYPVEKAKIKDLYKNPKVFKERFHREVGIYDTMPRFLIQDKMNVQEFIRTATGPFLALRNEIGLDMANRWKTSILRARDIKELKEKWCDDPILDHTFYYNLHSVYLHLNMNEYEDFYVGSAESKYSPFDFISPETRASEYAINSPFNPYSSPEANPYTPITSDDWKDILEPKLNYWRSGWEEENLAVEEDDDDDDEAEGDDDEDEIITYTPLVDHNPEFSDEEYEPVDWEPHMVHKEPKITQSARFGATDKIFDKYEDAELDSFMKFLDVQPFLGWRDRAGYHSRLGLHSIEDFSQRVDPDYWMLSEVEREMFERRIFKEHRQGSTVRFVVDGSKPNFDETLD